MEVGTAVVDVAAMATSKRIGNIRGKKNRTCFIVLFREAKSAPDAGVCFAAAAVLLRLVPSGSPCGVVVFAALCGITLCSTDIL